MFWRDVGIVVRVYSGVGVRQLALPSLRPCFRVEAPSCNTTIPQLSQDAGTTMRSWSNVFGLWTNYALVSQSCRTRCLGRYK